MTTKTDTAVNAVRDALHNACKECTAPAPQANQFAEALADLLQSMEEFRQGALSPGKLRIAMQKANDLLQRRAATPQVTPTLKEILKQYGAHHIRDCDALNKWTKLPCDCGFAALIEGTSEQASPTPKQCPTCGSDDKNVYDARSKDRTKRCHVKSMGRSDSWHSSAGTPKGTK